MEEATREGGCARASAEQRIDALELRPHPEGGWFRETWRSDLTLPQSALPGYDGPRQAGSCILYLLKAGEHSAPHRVRSDELWLFHEGDPLELSLGPSADEITKVFRLGTGADGWQALVPGGVWQSARPTKGPHGYVLVGCVVVPGFDFADFEMG